MQCVITATVYGYKMVDRVEMGNPWPYISIQACIFIQFVLPTFMCTSDIFDELHGKAPAKNYVELAENLV